jgi:hypothetical protein
LSLQSPILFLLHFSEFTSLSRKRTPWSLFLIAGYFVPGSFYRKGFSKFLSDRAMRLGIPTLIYMLFINTTINYYLLAFEWSTTRPAVWQFFLDYIQSLDFLSGSGPMWFALSLLIFSAAYAVFRLLLRDPESPRPEEELPGHLAVAGLALFIAAFAFSIRLVQPIGSSIMNMQLGYFSQYIVLFTTGVIASRKNWLVRIPYSFGMIWFKIVSQLKT